MTDTFRSGITTHSFDLFDLDICDNRGGRITRLYEKRLQRNLLVDEEGAPTLTLENDVLFPISGWVEVVPSIDPTKSSPTMGLAWNSPTHSVRRENQVVTKWDVSSWMIVRTLSVVNNLIAADYVISNRLNEPESVLFASHPLFPLHNSIEVRLPGGSIVPLKQEDAEWIRRCVRRQDMGGGISDSFRIASFPAEEKSYKFFVPATGSVAIRYSDADLEFTTDAEWWGIWLNLGQYGSRCIGVEATNAPSDAAEEVSCAIAPDSSISIGWELSVGLRESKEEN